MNQPYWNDAAFIAGAFCLDEDYIMQMSRLASFKINSYKLALVNSAFCASKDELGGIIKGSLLNFSAPASILAQIGFFEMHLDN